MFKHEQRYLKLFLATLLIVSIFSNSDRFYPTQTLAQELRSVSSQPQLVAKKSGGRSGGGSFKSKPKSRSGSRNNRNRASDSPRRDYNNDYEPTPSYNRSTNRGSAYGRQQMNPVVSFILMTVLFLLFGGIIFIPLFILFKSLFNKNSRAARRTQREIDNDRVTVSQIQVAFCDRASNIQQELSELSLNSNTETSEGLLELTREAALIVLRNSEAWTHVLSSSVAMNITEAESAFEALSLAERSKYSSENLSNVNGKIKTRQQAIEQGDDTGYLVVTLLFGTVDDKSLFDKINTEQLLAATLQQLAAMRADYLVKFELLWSPQTEGVYLTDEELLMEYTKMIPLV